MRDDYFSSAYPGVSESRWYKIPNLGVGGIDLEKFSETTAANYNAFTITYAGSFYDGWIEPYEFIKGLEKFDQQGEHNLKVQIYGGWEDEYQDAAEAAGISSIIETFEPVSYDEIISILKGSGALLYIGGNDPQNEYNISRKMSDYIVAKRPILAVIDPSFRAARLVEESGLGIVASPADTDDIAQAIDDLYTGEFHYEADDDLVSLIDNRSAMDLFADILDAVAEQRPIPKE